MFIYSSLEVYSIVSKLASLIFVPALSYLSHSLNLLAKHLRRSFLDRHDGIEERSPGMFRGVGN